MTNTGSSTLWQPKKKTRFAYGILKRKIQSQITGGAKKRKIDHKITSRINKEDNSSENESEIGEETLVAENQEIKLYVQLKALKRMTKFNIQDLLYNFKFEKLQPDENITILGVSDVLEKGLSKTIELVQEIYKDKKEDYLQMFVVFQDHGKKKKSNESSSTTQPIFTFNSGNYLLWQDSKKLSKEIWGKLSLYFQSNKDFTIDQGFYFSITILHSMHTKMRDSRPFKYKSPMTVGRNSENLLSFYGLNKTNQNYFEVTKKISSRNWCLPATLLYGKVRTEKILFDKLHNKLVTKEEQGTQREIDAYHDLLSSPYKTLGKKLNKFNTEMEKYSEKVLITETRSMLKQLNLLKKRKFDVQVDGAKIADYLNIQIYVYDRVGNQKVFQYPEERELSRPSLILFYQDSNAGKVGHVGLILAKSFFNGSYACPYCDKNVGYRQNAHYCQNTCYACKGLKVSSSQNLHLSNETDRGFCETDGHTYREYVISCRKCRIKCVSENCFKRHKKSSACEAGFFCEICRRYQRKTRTIKDMKTFLENHNCDEYTCKLCYEKYYLTDESSHVCKVKNIPPQITYPNLAFFDIETLAPETNPENCETCIKKELEYVKKHELSTSTRAELETFIEEEEKSLLEIRCNDHKHLKLSRQYHEVNALSLYYEDCQRGNFSRVAFYDPELNIEKDCVIEENVCESNYFLESMEQCYEIDRSIIKKQGRFSQGISDDTEEEVLTELANLDQEPINNEIGEDEELINISNSAWTHVNAPLVHTVIKKKQKRSKVTLDYEAELKDIKKLMVTEKFLLFILREKFRNYVIFSFNGQAFDHQYIVEGAYQLGLTPSIICRGQKILRVTFPQYNIRFLDFMLYKSGSLASLSKQAKLPEEKMDFPFLFNCRKNYNYEGPIPANRYFAKALEDPNISFERNTKLNEERKKGMVWKFKEQLQKYVHRDVHILLQLATKFLEECFQFQEMCSKMFPNESREVDEECPYLHPYGDPFMTLSGYVFGSWKYYCLEKANLYVVNDEKGEKTINTSQKEHEWIAFLQHEYGKKYKLASAFTSAKPPSFGHIKPDWYIKKLKSVGEFKGCHIHGHFDDDGFPCRLIPKSNWNSENMFKEKYIDVKRRKDRQQTTLINQFGIENFVTMHECEWDQLKSGENLHKSQKSRSKRVRKFLKKYYKKRPLHRLCPRVALRGGKVEAYYTDCDVSKNSSSTMKHLDYNSLYPSVCTISDNVFPSGKPETIIHPHDIKKVKITPHGAYFKDKKIEGLIHAQVKIKQSMYPFLQYRAHGKSYCALCKNCVEMLKERPCQCPAEKKGFISVWTVPDLVHAVSIGDKIEKIFEVLSYEDYDNYLKEFLDVLSSYKIRHSSFGTSSYEELKEICDAINKEMKFMVPELILTPEILEENPQLKEFFKLWSNALLGKFSQWNEKIKHWIIKNQGDLNKLINNPNYTIEEVLPIGEILQVGVKPKSSVTSPSLNTQVVVGAYVTAYARIEMDKAFRRNLSKDVELLYTDTDSAMLNVKNGASLDLKFGNSYREWKSELPKNAVMLDYCALGPKSYSYRYKKGEEIFTALKCKGFSLKNNSYLNHESLKNMVTNRRKSGVIAKKLIPQFNIRIEKKTRRMHNLYYFKTLSSDILKKRVLIKNSSRTMPYGYCSPLFDSV